MNSYLLKKINRTQKELEKNQDRDLFRKVDRLKVYEILFLDKGICEYLPGKLGESAIRACPPLEREGNMHWYEVIAIPSDEDFYADLKLYRNLMSVQEIPPSIKEALNNSDITWWNLTWEELEKRVKIFEFFLKKSRLYFISKVRQPYQVPKKLEINNIKAEFLDLLNEMGIGEEKEEEEHFQLALNFL
jgi:hypothetical protein